jgi:hypothetical protein
MRANLPQETRHLQSAGYVTLRVHRHNDWDVKPFWFWKFCFSWTIQQGKMLFKRGLAAELIWTNILPLPAFHIEDAGIYIPTPFLETSVHLWVFHCNTRQYYEIRKMSKFRTLSWLVRQSGNRGDTTEWGRLIWDFVFMTIALGHFITMLRFVKKVHTKSECSQITIK